MHLYCFDDTSGWEFFISKFRILVYLYVLLQFRTRINTIPHFQENQWVTLIRTRTCRWYNLDKFPGKSYIWFCNFDGREHNFKQNINQNGPNLWQAEISLKLSTAKFLFFFFSQVQRQGYATNKKCRSANKSSRRRYETFEVIFLKPISFKIENEVPFSDWFASTSTKLKSQKQQSKLVEFLFNTCIYIYKHNLCIPKIHQTKG